jgi:hypothetical protein
VLRITGRVAFHTLSLIILIHFLWLFFLWLFFLWLVFLWLFFERRAFLTASARKPRCSFFDTRFLAMPDLFEVHKKRRPAAGPV